MKEIVTLNRREQRRLVVLNRVEAGKMLGWEAAKGLWPKEMQNALPVAKVILA